MAQENWWENDPLADVSAVKAEGDTPEEAAAKEGERKAAFLATQLANAVNDIGKATAKDPSAASPPIMPAIVGSLLPGSLGETAANYVRDDQRQTVENAQLNALDAALTLGTGAAYTKEQLANYNRFMFPQLGDGPETISAKQRRMKVMLQAGRIAAGAAAPQIDQALKTAGIDMGPVGSVEEQIATIKEMDFLDSNAKASLIAKLQSAPTGGGDPGGEFNSQIEQMIRSGESPEAIERVWTDSGRPFRATDRATIIRALDAVKKGGGVEVATERNDDPSLLEGLVASTVDKFGDVAKGVAALPDAFIDASGGAIQYGAELLGADEFARTMANRGSIGGAIDSILPDYKSSGLVDDVSGFLAEFTGGAASMPARVTNAITGRIAGELPQIATAPTRSVFAANPAKDMDALGMTPRPAITGGLGARALSAISEATPVGTVLHGRAAMKMSDEAERALSNIATREGLPANAETAGEIATKGALGFRDNSRSTVGRLFDRAEKAAGDVRVRPDRTIEALDQSIAELNEVPLGTEGLKHLKELRDELFIKFPKGISVNGIRGLRTQLRDKFYREGLRGSDIERRINQVTQNISDDIAQTLDAAGKSEAASLYRQADKEWAERVTTLDNFIMPIIGRKGEKSGEEVFKALQQAAKSKGVKLKRFIDALPEAEAGTTRASLIEGLGKASDSAADDFSFADFAARWKGMGETAKNAFFSTDARTSIDRLARTAERAKRAGRYINYSRSGAVAVGAGTFMLDSVATMGAALGAQTAAGLLLTNPSVARVLAKFASAENPGQAKAAIKSLTEAAKRNPVIANDIAGLQQRLMDSLSRPLAAEEKPAPVEPE